LYFKQFIENWRKRNAGIGDLKYPGAAELVLLDMKIFKNLIGAAALLLALSAGVVWVEHAVARPSLTGFEPRTMGCLEASMWRSYYDRAWLRLAGLTVKGACGQFGYSWWDASRMALHAGRAALFFRDKTDDPGCRPALERFFAIAQKATDREFDIHDAALLELGWWKARRQGMTPEEYAQMMAQQASLLFGAPEEVFLPACLIRAEAMASLESRPGGAMTGADWQEISRQLMDAYEIFKNANVQSR